MNMHVDMHISIWAQDAANSVTLAQTQLGQNLDIFVNTLDVAVDAPRQFTHRQRALP